MTQLNFKQLISMLCCLVSWSSKGFWISSLAFIFLVCSCKKNSNGPYAAEFGIQTIGSSCVAFDLSGAYIQGKALDSSNKVLINVNVSSRGHWELKSTNVNGFYFAGSGSFTAIGLQSVALIGNGRPTLGGDLLFNLVEANSSCNFTVHVEDSNYSFLRNGYWPLTVGSSWKYSVVGGDSLTRTAIGPVTLSNRVYEKFQTRLFLNNETNYHYIRKDSSGAYYFYGDTATSTIAPFDIHFLQNGLDIIFLKDSVHSGDRFYTDYPALQNDKPVTARFNNLVLDVDETLTVNGKTFNHVCDIRRDFDIGVNGVFTNWGTFDHWYFVKQVGLIKSYNTELVTFKIR